MTSITSPIDNHLTDELYEFWDRIFGGQHDIPPGAFRDDEIADNRYDVYFERREDHIVATCNILASHDLPTLGGLGEVATDPAHRRQGLATRLCQRALTDFGKRGGEALFLGTENWSAACLYHRLGWRKLAGSNVMVYVTSRESPESFLVEYFRRPSRVTIKAGGPFLRIPLIPLLNTPHDWLVLDVNAQMVSTRYQTQTSCNSLYRRYQSPLENDRGRWFAAVTDDHRVVGVSTAILDESRGCCVDGFVHSRFENCLPDLLASALNWGETVGSDNVYTLIGQDDSSKQIVFESLGFRQRDEQPVPFQLADRQILLQPFSAHA